MHSNKFSISLFFALLLSLWLAVTSAALAAPSDNDSCTTTGANLAASESIKIGQLIVGITTSTGNLSALLPTFATDIGAYNTLPVSSANSLRIMEGFSMTDAQNCEEQTNNVSFCYNPLTFNGTYGRFYGGGSTRTCDDDSKKTLAVGGSSYVAGSWFQAVRDTSYLCIQIQTVSGWVTLGCKDDNSVTESEGVDKACYISDSCVERAWDDSEARKSKSFFPLSSNVIRCVKETLANIFQNPTTECLGAGNRTNLFPAFQEAMRRAIGAALTLYIIFFGAKIAMGQEMPKKAEIFMFLLKFTLVLYFSIGDGIRKDFYPAFINATGSLSDIAFRAGGSRGLCSFDPDSYDRGYGYLALWDSLDCRIAYYFGIQNGDSYASPFLLSLMIPLLWMFQILPIIMMALFAIFFLSIAIFVTQAFILSLICITIMAYLAPLFVPMALFKQTKAYFDSWLRMFFGYVVHPILLFGFLALCMTIFDGLYYGTCQFKDVSIGDLKVYTIDKDASAGDTDCTDSMGYKLSIFKEAADDGTLTEQVDAVFFSVNIISDEYWENNGKMFTNLAMLAFLGFLFYHFVQMLNALATDLSGAASPTALYTSANMGSTAPPLALFNAATSKIGKAGDVAIGKIRGKPKEEDKKKEGEKKEDKDKKE